MHFWVRPLGICAPAPFATYFPISPSDPSRNSLPRAARPIKAGLFDEDESKITRVLAADMSPTLPVPAHVACIMIAIAIAILLRYWARKGAATTFRFCQ